MSANGNDPVHRALDVFVYTPVGFALMAWQRAPGFVSDVIQRGLTQLGEAEANVNRARMIGQVAVTYGTRLVRRDLDARLGGALRRAECLTGRLPLIGPEVGDGGGTEPATQPAPRPAAAEAPPAPAARATPRTPRPAPTDLPIPEYDGLSASQVVSRLSGLTPAELEAVAAYEAAGRARKTVLAAIDRLQSA